jgi:hypothetical protein
MASFAGLIRLSGSWMHMDSVGTVCDSWCEFNAQACGLALSGYAQIMEWIVVGRGRGGTYIISPSDLAKTGRTSLARIVGGNWGKIALAMGRAGGNVGRGFVFLVLYTTCTDPVGRLCARRLIDCENWKA